MLTLQEFIDHLERREKRGNRELVEAVVYYLTVVQGSDSCTAAELRKEFISINHTAPSRTSQYLSEGTGGKRQQYVKKGKGYALHRRNLVDLNSEFSEFLEVAKPKIESGLLDANCCTGGRQYLVSIALQINGSYEYGFYDATAVLMRRMMETLIISAFQKQGQEYFIIDKDGNFLMLNALINQAKDKNKIKLSRGMGETMDLIKDLGDTAAHNRTYITKKEDVDTVQIKFRRLIEELCILSGIHQPS